MVKTVKSIKKKNRFVFDTLLKINRFVKWLNIFICISKSIRKFKVCIISGGTFLNNGKSWNRSYGKYPIVFQLENDLNDRNRCLHIYLLTFSIKIVSKLYCNIIIK